MADPYRTAVWRYEQIAPFEDLALTQAERAALIAQRTDHPVLWPSGKEEPIPRSTLYRWLAAYRKPCRRCEKRKKCPDDKHCERQVQALLPKRRDDLGKPRCDRGSWIQKAIQMLLVRPARSLTLLLAFLKARFADDLDLKRSTLQRELHAHPLWPVVLRRRKGDKRLRTRFEPKFVHETWHLDGKGPFTVRLESGGEIRVTILTILEAFSRSVLAVTISRSEDTAAAVRVFRSAAARWGLPHRILADRHGVYDSHCFRTGLAMLGVNRVWVKSRNPQVNGKLEAYHRTLTMWVIDELPHQGVVDLDHLLELLQAVIDHIYQPHHHREIKTSPAEALKEQRSDRSETSIDDLRKVFWESSTLKAHPTTGEINLPGGPFRVPPAYAGARVQLRYDPAEPTRAFLVGRQGKWIQLEPRAKRPPKPDKPATQRRGTGELQQLMDSFRDQKRPVARPGFGFPEICDALGACLQRHVPQTEDEADLLLEFYRHHGPFAPDAFDKALKRTMTALGPGRPVKAIVTYLTRLVVPASPDAKERTQ